MELPKLLLNNDEEERKSFYLAEAMLLASFEILSDLNNCSSPESALEGIFNAGWMQLSGKIQNCRCAREKHTNTRGAHTHR